MGKMRRDEYVALGAGVVEMLRGKTVLVTGAGGTIGREIVWQVVRNGATRVIMIDRNDNALYEIDREMRESCVNAICVSELADIANEARMRRILKLWTPQIVFHAAANKHVPMMEANPLEGLRNNAIATWKFGEWCGECGVKHFMMISTDKAVRPISVMGMTKRLAESMVLELNDTMAHTCYSCVRFGNVLGASGSVEPLFREQIARRGPVTVTHPDMCRYFIGLKDAVSLVLDAMVMAKECIYTLDMGQPVRILDLAEELIREAGYKPYAEVPIVFTGMRPGEELFDELDLSESSVFKTGNPRIFICREARLAGGVSAKDIESFAMESSSDDEVRRFLHDCVSQGGVSE